jgi:hypothetical protein
MLSVLQSYPPVAIVRVVQRGAFPYAAKCGSVPTGAPGGRTLVLRNLKLHGTFIGLRQFVGAIPA